MRIPDGPSGVPTVSANQFRTYGAAGFQLDEQEADQGCPRVYFARYVAEEPFPEEEKSYELRYGAMFHNVLFAMEEDGLDPEDALQREFDPTLPFSAFEEARKDLTGYMERGAAPRDRYMTLAVEVELEGVLFVDPKYGEIRYRGIIDWIGLDPEDPRTLHVVDYKTNRSPFRNADILGDVQMRGYDWLVRQVARRWVSDGVVNIVIHLDAVKFREVEHRFTDSEIDDWHSWAVAVARAILQDEEHLPTLNPRCGTCPIRHDCSAFLEMPQTAALVVAAQPAEAAARVQWREEANRLRLTLEKAVKQIDAEFAAAAMESGGMVLGGFQWEVQMDIRTEFDLPGLFAVLGSDRFYRAVTTSKAAIERVTKDADLSTVAAAQSMISETAVGTKVVRRKAGR